MLISVNRNTPRWLIFLIDTGIVAFSVILAYLLRFNFDIPEGDRRDLPLVFAIILGVRILSFLLSRTYAGIIRYTSTQDAFRIAMVIFSGSLVFVVTNLFTYYFIDQKFYIPFSIIIIELITSIFMMTTFRLMAKVTFLEISGKSGKERKQVVLFGAGQAGLTTKRALERDPDNNYKIISFVDDDHKKVNMKMENVRIAATSQLPELLNTHQIDQLIITPQKMRPARKKELIELCLSRDIKVFHVPPVSRWINGELSSNQIKRTKIEDLLGRDEIKLAETTISNDLNKKVVLITGACGSIGSEMVRQIARFNPEKLILLDQAESPMYELELECRELYPQLNVEVVIANISHQARIQRVFQHFKPQVVYHAAAYKHVPMMENNPAEAVHTNVQGTRLLADYSLANGVEKFIMISTDKAVNPTNVMGTTKRIAEMYIQALNQEHKTAFITTRFGNVLGSNGSVIPLFRKQIEKGGPLTITHPEVTRYFMTIPEACQLVLEAGAMGKGGEIYIFDMGKSVKIIDLAKKMIKLSGLALEKDIQITFTGLRPGEKLYEELLNDRENTLPTHHPQIMIAKVEHHALDRVTTEIDELLALIGGQDNLRLVGKMKQIVPEFISKNSIYQQLD